MGLGKIALVIGIIVIFFWITFTMFSDQFLYSMGLNYREVQELKYKLQTMNITLLIGGAALLMIGYALTRD